MKHFRLKTSLEPFFFGSVRDSQIFLASSRAFFNVCARRSRRRFGPKVRNYSQVVLDASWKWLRFHSLSVFSLKVPRRFQIIQSAFCIIFSVWRFCHVKCKLSIENRSFIVVRWANLKLTVCWERSWRSKQVVRLQQPQFRYFSLRIKQMVNTKKKQNLPASKPEMCLLCMNLRLMIAEPKQFQYIFIRVRKSLWKTCYLAFSLLETSFRENGSLSQSEDAQHNAEKSFARQ